MKVIGKWKFIKKNIPYAERYKAKNQMMITDIGWINSHFRPKHWMQSDTILLCGDGSTLPEDVTKFEKMGVKHDVMCINRSLLYFERPINHWAAIDAEESAWLSENLTAKVVPKDSHILRHTIGYCPIGFDIYWKVNQEFENETQRHVWSGNSGYFGVLACLAMGYKRVVIAGMPLDTKPHWYESDDKPGPNWVGQTYRTWMDFKSTQESAARVRSLSGYSKFIFGEVTEKWLQPLNETAALKLQA